MELDKKALNLEMLQIAGFTCTGGIWTYPDGVDVDNGVPFFPDSLDECFKWLVPKALGIIGKQSYEGKLIWARCELMTKWLHKWNDNPDYPALAFCLAMKELK